MNQRVVCHTPSAPEREGDDHRRLLWSHPGKYQRDLGDGLLQRSGVLLHRDVGGHVYGAPTKACGSPNHPGASHPGTRCIPMPFADPCCTERREEGVAVGLDATDAEARPALGNPRRRGSGLSPIHRLCSAEASTRTLWAPFHRRKGAHGSAQLCSTGSSRGQEF